MTKQESFKRRVRARMEKTGERYAAARRALLDQSSAKPGRQWVSDPETTDEAVRAATGKGWDEWCDIIDQWPDRTDDHTAIAAYLNQELGVGQWWSQGITVGYERISGLRLPYQRSDGTFTAGKSTTAIVDAAMLRELLLSEEGRAELFAGHASELRSKPTSRAIRIALGPGVAQFSIENKGDGRARVGVSHEKLPTYDDVEPWKFFWEEWLAAIDDPAATRLSSAG